MRRPAQVDRRRRLVERGVDVGGGGRGDLGRRRRVAAQVPLGHPDAADVDRAGRPRRRVGADGRTRSSRRRCRPRGTGRSTPARQPAGRTGEGEARPPRRPVTTSGAMPTPRRRSRTPSTNSAALRGVTGGRGGHEPDPLDARASALRGVRRRATRACGPSPRGRARRCGRRPWPSRTISIRRIDVGRARRVRAGRRRRRAGGSSWCRSRSRRPAVTVALGRSRAPGGARERGVRRRGTPRPPGRHHCVAARRAPRRRAG